MRVKILALVVVVTAIVGGTGSRFSACAAETAVAKPETSQSLSGELIASAKAPKSDSWLESDRWKDEEKGGRQAVKLSAPCSYVNLDLASEAPTAGSDYLVLRAVYFAEPGLKPFSMGIGGWGSPVIKISVQNEGGWCIAEAAFPSLQAVQALNGQKIKTTFSGDKSGLPSFSEICIYKPDEKYLKSLYAKYVQSGTAQAWTDSSQSPFTCLEDYDSKDALEPSPEDQSKGVVPFVRTYMDPVYPLSVPKAAERKTEASIRVTPGEYEPVQVAIRALQTLDNCSVKISGSLPSGITAYPRWVECVPLRTAGGSSSTKWHVQPNRLWPLDIFPSVKVEKDKSQAFWVIFKASKLVKPGKYQVAVEVVNSGKSLVQFKVNIEVLPFTLPEKLDHSFGFYESRFIDEITAKDMFEHGCNSLSTWQDSKPFNDAEGKIDFSAWDEYFKMLKSNGMDKSFVWFVGNKGMGNTVLKSLGESAFTQILAGINERVADGRYPSSFFVTIDEAVQGGSIVWGQMKKLNEEISTKDTSLKRFGVSLDKHSFAQRYLGMIDVLSCNGSFAENSAWCAENKIGMYTYTVFCGRTVAGISRYNCGFNPWRYGAKGTYGWALRWYNGHPFNDMDAGVSDWGIVLPNWCGTPISSPAWEGWREGVDDVRYLAKFDELLKAGKVSPVILEDIRAMLKESSLSQEQNVGESVFESLIGETAKMDKARNMLIDAIISAK